MEILEACLRDNALCVPSEEAVVKSLLRWLGHDLPGRQRLLLGLLSLTRLHHLPAAVLTVTPLNMHIGAHAYIVLIHTQTYTFLLAFGSGQCNHWLSYKTHNGAGLAEDVRTPALLCS